VTDTDSLGFRLATRGLGGSAELGVLRDGKSVTLSVAMLPAPEIPLRDEMTLEGRHHPFNGIKVVNLSPAMADELSLDPWQTGVAVSGISDERRSAGGSVFERGDIIHGINGTQITSVRQLERLLKSRQGAWQIDVQRGKRRQTLYFRG
jgi:hypothetical protein